MDTLHDLLDALPSLDTRQEEWRSLDARLSELLEARLSLERESPTSESETERSSSPSSADAENADAWREDLPPDGTPSFNYLYKRLVAEQEPLVLLGESPSRALSIAFAVMRGSLKDIWATRLEAKGAFWDATNFAEHIENSKRRGKSNSACLTSYWNFDYNADPDHVNFIDRCQDAPDEMEFLPNFSLQADARYLPALFSNSGLRHLGHKNIFFQCPWSGWSSTGLLLQETMNSAAEIQGPGDLLLFGLIDTRLESYSDLDVYRSDIYTRYKKAYDVPALKSCAVRHGYEVLAEDKDLIKHCLRFGYRHHSDTPVYLHYYMLRRKQLVVHVFVKMQVTKQSFRDMRITT
ncbi:hypothetical protein B0H17DRAFT_1186651 [Mycena rosella]|uniref:Uncharacterized protein n=1 Tax=Mycena rosella TaxID=1033263 RepID=A0AAD7CHR8_MYCRO|nr:hypothetical protein B0H17DRAFT_1186651 [Mycena rosella]